MAGLFRPRCGGARSYQLELSPGGPIHVTPSLLANADALYMPWPTLSPPGREPDMRLVDVVQSCMEQLRAGMVVVSAQPCLAQ